MTSPYAEVIGDPIVQSKSPLIHRFWLGKLGIEGGYRARRVERGGVGRYLAERTSDPDWLGCNVTMPLKREALQRAQSNCSKRAKAAGAANLLLPAGASLGADNSDVIAVEQLLAAHFRTREQVVVHLIGTGGAAAAAAVAVQNLGPPVNLFTYARSEESALAFRQRVGLEPSPLLCHPLGSGEPWGSQSDIVINATPLGMSGHGPLPFVIDHFAPGATVFDMVYNPVETQLLQAAREAGMRTIDGLAMLIEQAAYSFTCFFRSDPPREHDMELRRLLTA